MMVRMQIRAILRKSGCESLREQECQMDTLAAHVPQCRVESG